MYLFTRISQNKKIGPIPSIIASKDTCPDSCALKQNGCYAEYGPLSIHWNRAKKVGLDFASLLQRIRSLPRGTLFRYGVAGDLPTDLKEVVELAEASKGRKVIAYTHRRDFDLLRSISAAGFNVNLSADSIAEADELTKTGLPVVVVLSSFYHRRIGETLRAFRDRIGGRLSFETPAGNRVAVCPATYLDTNCASCQACAKPRVGNTIIGFPAHGTKKHVVDDRVSNEGLSPWLDVRRKESSSTPLRVSARTLQ